MRTHNPWRIFVASGITAVLLAGCASTPAPVVNRSFGGSEVASSTAQPASASSGAATIPIGHANGTVTQTGYTVAPGDTLYSIAFQQGLDYRALAARNNIPPPYVIHPGQVLQLGAAPATAPGSNIVIPGEKVTTVTTPSSATSSPQAPSAPVFGPVMTQPMTASGVAPASASSVGTIVRSPASSAPTAVATTTAAPSIPPAATVAPPPAQPVVAATPTPPPGKSRTVAGIVWRWPASGKVISGFQAGSGGDGAGLDIAGNSGDPVRAAADGTVVYSGNGLIGYGELIIIKHNDSYLSAYGHNRTRLVKEGQHVRAGEVIAEMGSSGAPRDELHFEIRKNGKPVDPADYLPER